MIDFLLLLSLLAIPALLIGLISAVVWQCDLIGRALTFIFYLGLAVWALLCGTLFVGWVYLREWTIELWDRVRRARG